MNKIYIAANNGDMGGGEVMLLNIARVLRSLGRSVTIVGPAQPAELVDAAQDEGFSTVILPATNRRDYLVQLRAWDRKQRNGLLWCNGLLPAVATAGSKNRIVHLHQLPAGKQKFLLPLARRGAQATIVPSNYLSTLVPQSRVLHNWVHEVPAPLVRDTPGDIFRVGFLGRTSTIKGTDVLAQAVYELNNEFDGRFRLILGGSAKFVDTESQKTVGDTLARLGQSVEAMGWVTPESFMKNIDVLVMPSVWGEPFGLVAAEAMSARVPLIISDAGALPEVVGENYPWVARQGDPIDLARVIRDCRNTLLIDPETAQEIAGAAYWRWQEHFSPEAGKARVADVLSYVEEKLR